MLFCSVALLEHLSTQSARELLVAVVPALVPPDAREVILDDSIEPLNRLNPAADLHVRECICPITPAARNPPAAIQWARQTQQLMEAFELGF